MRLLYPTGKDCQEIYLKYFIFFKIFTKPEMPPPALSSQGRHFRFLGYFYEDDENLALSVLERSGGAYFQEKNLPTSGHSGAGKEQPPAFWTTKRFCALQLILPTKSPPSRRVRGRVYRKNAYSTMKVQVAAGRTRSPAAAVTGAISGRVLFSPRTRSLPLQRMVWLRRVSADSW